MTLCAGGRGRQCVGAGAEEELHDVEVVWLDAHSNSWGAESS